MLFEAQSLYGHFGEEKFFSTGIKTADLRGRTRVTMPTELSRSRKDLLVDII